MKNILFACLFLMLSINAEAQTEINSLPNYTWDISDEPKTFSEKIQISFVNNIKGFPSFGTVLAGGSYSTAQDGGVFQLYFPYSPNYGGTAPKVRLGKYNNQGWSDWETFYTSVNANQSTIDWSAKKLLVDYRIGIGTTNPLARLHIKNGDNSYGAILANSTQSAFGLYTKSLSTGQNAEVFRLGLKYNTVEDNGFISFYRGTSSSGGFLGFSTNGSERIRIAKDGNVGIGVADPDHPLSVNGNGAFRDGSNLDIVLTKPGGNNGIVFSAKGYSNYTRFDMYNKSDANSTKRYFYMGYGASTGLTVAYDDNVGIGTSNTKGFKLGVNGKIAAEEVKVALYANWPDFVFEKEYELPTLKEVKEHIEQNGHLQGIPSAEEVGENGFFLGEMDAKLLQKVEELTLYTIDQEKRLLEQQQKLSILELQQAQIDLLKKELMELRKEIENK